MPQGDVVTVIDKMWIKRMNQVNFQCIYAAFYKPGILFDKRLNRVFAFKHAPDILKRPAKFLVRLPTNLSLAKAR